MVFHKRCRELPKLSKDINITNFGAILREICTFKVAGPKKLLTGIVFLENKKKIELRCRTKKSAG